MTTNKKRIKLALSEKAMKNLEFLVENENKSTKKEFILVMSLRD